MFQNRSNYVVSNAQNLNIYFMLFQPAEKFVPSIENLKLCLLNLGYLSLQVLVFFFFAEG